MDMKTLVKHCLYILPDEAYLALRYRMAFGRFPDFKNPRTYNEKLQWLKLHDRNPVYHEMVDKLAAKRFAARRIGEEYIPGVLGVWERVEDIDYDALPERFVLKCTHDSGSVVLCDDRKTFDRDAAEKLLRRGLAMDYYKEYREWPYKDVPRRILAEEFLAGEGERAPDDYKVMCFGGQPKLVILHQGRFGGHTMDFYDTGWNRLPITRVGQPRSESDAPRPEQLEQMLTLSAVLAKDIPHLRVDWYISDGRLYLGELTFFNASGFGPFVDPEDDLLLGSWIPLGERMSV